MQVAQNVEKKSDISFRTYPNDYKALSRYYVVKNER